MEGQAVLQILVSGRGTWNLFQGLPGPGPGPWGLPSPCVPLLFLGLYRAVWETGSVLLLKDELAGVSQGEVWLGAEPGLRLGAVRFSSPAFPTLLVSTSHAPPPTPRPAGPVLKLPGRGAARARIPWPSRGGSCWGLACCLSPDQKNKVSDFPLEVCPLNKLSWPALHHALTAARHRCRTGASESIRPGYGS